MAAASTITTGLGLSLLALSAVCGLILLIGRLTRPRYVPPAPKIIEDGGVIRVSEKQTLF